MKIKKLPSISASVKPAAVWLFLFCFGCVAIQLSTSRWDDRTEPNSERSVKKLQTETVASYISSLPSLERSTQSEKYRVGDGICWTARDPVSLSRHLSFTCHCCRDSTQTLLSLSSRSSLLGSEVPKCLFYLFDSHEHSLIDSNYNGTFFCFIVGT